MSTWGRARRRAQSFRRLGSLLCLCAIALSSTAIPTNLAAAAPQGSPQPLTVNLSGSNGVGRIMTPGRPCSDGGTGGYRHYSIDSPLPSGVLSQLTGTLRGSLDVHHDGQEPPTGPVQGGAFLLGTQSHVTLTNYRGAVQLLLQGGQCGSLTAPLTFSADGHQINTGPFSGAFTVNTDKATTNGSYRGATGSGTYTLSAGVAPGADNGWSLALNGNLSILEPALNVSVVKTFWGNLGLDYALRIVSVTYQITNSGQGDAFNTSLVSTSSPNNNVTALGPQPQTLGDLAAGQVTQVTVRYRLGLLSPCLAVILNCNFTSVVTVSLPDALDVPATPSATLPITAPVLPPPLS
jgi:hypothetical protein